MNLKSYMACVNLMFSTLSWVDLTSVTIGWTRDGIITNLCPLSWRDLHHGQAAPDLYFWLMRETKQGTLSFLVMPFVNYADFVIQSWNLSRLTWLLPNIFPMFSWHHVSIDLQGKQFQLP